VHPTSPFLVAHRAGNDRVRLRAAEARGFPVVEADVRLYRRRRIDVRHGRRLGRLPVVYDEGRLAPAGASLTLEELLAEAAPSTGLLLDLKGLDLRLSQRVLDTIAPHLEHRRVAVCARAWRLLGPFRDEPRVRLVPSVGSRRQLDAFLAGLPSTGTAGVSVRDSLVDAATVRRLRDRAGVVFCWTVNCGRRAAELATWGVDGITTDTVDALSGVAREPRLALGAA
jgi:hypothetical protein